MTPTLSVYLDECVDRALAPAIRARGFLARSAWDIGGLGATDDEQLAYATEYGYLLLSHNKRDFQRLHVRIQTHGGIILIPATSQFARLSVRASMLLDWIGTFPEHRSRLFQWGHLQDLLDGGLRLPGYTDAEVRLARGRPA